MYDPIYAGDTSVSLNIMLYDQSSTIGAGLSGITHATSNLTLEYRRQGSLWQAVPLVTKTLGIWVSGGIAADGTLAGAYELDVPNACFADGAEWVLIRLHGATNLLPCVIRVPIHKINYQDGVRAGLTSLANASAGASGGLSLVGSAMTLTSGERTAIANEVEAQIIDDTDTEKVLEAIVNKINSMTDLDTLSLAAIATAVRNELATELARIDATVSSRMPDGDTTVEDTYTQVLAAITSLNTLLNRLGAFTGSGTNTVLGILKAMCRKDLSAPSDVGGTFSPATDSLEGIADTWDQLTIAATGFAIGEDRNKQSTILSYTEEDSLINIFVYDSDGNEVDIEAFDMNITFEPIRSGTTYTVADGDIVLKDGNNVRFYPPAGLHDEAKHYVWSLRKESPNALLGTGTYKVVYAP